MGKAVIFFEIIKKGKATIWAIWARDKCLGKKIGGTQEGSIYKNSIWGLY